MVIIADVKEAFERQLVNNLIYVLDKIYVVLKNFQAIDFLIN